MSTPDAIRPKMMVVVRMADVVQAARAFIDADQKQRAVGNLEPQTIRNLRLALVALDMTEESAK